MEIQMIVGRAVMDKLLTELLQDGTIGGHASLEAMRRSRFALILDYTGQVKQQRVDLTKEAEMAEAAGVVHDVLVQLHQDRLVQLLVDELTKLQEDGRLIGGTSPLYDELANSRLIRS